MRVIFTAPEKTSYHDNTTWFTHNQKNAAFQGIWLKPGERVVVLPPETIKVGDEVYATMNTVWGNEKMKVTFLTLGFIHVDHPIFGHGAFPYGEVVKA